MLLGLGVLGLVCVEIVRDAGASADDKKWATAILGSLISVGAGYLVGRATK